MDAWFATVDDLHAGRDILVRRRYGVIECRDGRFRRVRLRPIPKIVAAPDVLVFGAWRHRLWPGDSCRLYYNQPCAFSNFLVLKYIVSSRDAAGATVLRALETLDEIARLKRSDALLCEAANWRVSDRLLARWGWQPHCPSAWRRHFIKRFYGTYPPPAAWLARRPLDNPVPPPQTCIGSAAYGG